MASSDATAAYRGYRLQALYTLHRILVSEASGTLVFQPEGAEDLAVYGVDGYLLEINQVKAYKDNLTLSDFEPDKEASFFYRAEHHLKSTPNAHIYIVSFGPIGPELYEACSMDGRERQSVADKLSKHKYISKKAAEALLAQIKLVQVQEAILIEEVYAALRESCTGIDSRGAFALMTAWLYQCGEHKTKITRNDVLTQITTIGQFLAECAAHQREWFTTIKPIQEMPLKDEDISALVEEYYHGVSARYEHIVAGLDLRRPEKLQAITEGFQQHQVVIVHGASGQGKTSLAYRFLYESFPEYGRFEILRIESVAHALSIATALISHVNALAIPIAIYLDVIPGDTSWAELVQQLAPQQYIRTLVTIREEDWRRSTLSVAEAQFSTISLQLEAAEAQALYEALEQKQLPAHFLSFEDAWTKFGGPGPLMEFIHLVTQGTTLRERLRLQVQRLEDEVRIGKFSSAELDALRLVSVAAAWGARLQANRLTQSLQLSAPRRTFDLLEQEYLLRVSEDGSLVGGLHPLRSSFLAELLTDPSFAPWAASASRCLPLLYGEDVEIFLLTSFSRRPADRRILLKELTTWQPDHWVAIHGVVRALLWLGIAEYVNENQDLLREALADAGNGGIFLIDFDIARVLPNGTAGLWEQLEGAISPERRNFIASLHARQTPKAGVFSHLSAWLSDRTQPPVFPRSERDWAGVAETTFWLGYLHHSWPLTTWLPTTILDSAIASLPLERLADLILGLTGGYGEDFTIWYQQRSAQILRQFRVETATAVLEDDGTKVTAHFFLEGAIEQSPATKENKLRLQDERNPLHNAALQRINLLRRLLPDREFYACQGYGHRLWRTQLPTDDTHKGGIPRSKLHPYWLTTVNATFRGLMKMLVRPQTWEEYVQQIVGLRQAVLATLSHLQQALVAYFRRQNQLRIWGELIEVSEWEQCQQRLRAAPFLPRCAVDEWGFVDEDSANLSHTGLPDNTAQIISIGLALQEYKPFLQALSTYTRTFSNFLGQSPQVIALNPVLGRGTTDHKQRALALPQQQGWQPENMYRLSTLNFTDAIKGLSSFRREYRHLLGKFAPASQLSQLERQEEHILTGAWEMWYIFVFHPERFAQQAAEHCHQQVTGLLSQVRKHLQKTFQESSSEATRATILSEQVSWEDQPALWIAIDGQRPIDAYAKLETVLQALRSAVSSIKNIEMRPYLLTVFWAQVVIVPRVKGKCLLPIAWQWPLLRFQPSNDATEMPWWNYFQHPIPALALAKLGLSSWELPAINKAFHWLEAVTALSFLTAHIRDLKELPELDDQGEDALRRYLQRLGDQLTTGLKQVRERRDEINEVVMLSAASSNEEQETDQLESQQVLDELTDAVFPSRDARGSIDMTVEMIGTWADRMDTVREQATLFYLLFAGAVVDINI